MVKEDGPFQYCTDGESQHAISPPTPKLVYYFKPMLDSDGNYVVESHILEEHIQQQSQCDKQANQWHAETQKTKGT